MYLGRVRSAGRVAALLAVGAAVGCGSSSTISVALPQRLQREVAKTEPILAFVPTRLPPGYRYADHSVTRSGFDIWFSKAGEAPDQLGFHVRKASCATQGSAMHAFHINGAVVSWSATYEDQEAWRCFARGSVRFVISASRSIPGDDSLDTPRRLHHALDLVRLVAYVRHIK